MNKQKFFNRTLSFAFNMRRFNVKKYIDYEGK